MITENEKAFIQTFREADEAGKQFIVNMLLCVAQCGDSFLQEMMEVKGNRAEMEAVIARYLPTLERREL